MRSSVTGLQAVTAACLLAFANLAQASILVSAGGVTNDFSIAPSGIGEWFTLDPGGDRTTVASLAQLNALAQSVDAASTTNVVLLQPGDTSSQRMACWSGGLLYTRPTYSQAGIVIARLQNASGVVQSSLSVQYDLGLSATNDVAEEVGGQVLYFSMTGAPNSWTNVAQYLTSGTVTLTLNLPGWANGAGLYLMWMDDNGSGSPDWLCTIDNVVFSVPNASLPPQITSPMRNQTNSVGANATFTVGVSGATPMVYFWFTNRVFAQTNSSGVFSAGPLVLGSNFLCTVVASNAVGTATNSASAWGVVLPPVVSLTSPTNGASYLAPASLTLTATAEGRGYAVTNVSFYAGTSKVGQVSASPYSISWNGVAAGSYALTAVATDNSGLSATSTVANVTVLQVGMSLGTSYSFDTVPSATMWSSLSLAGSGGSYSTADALDTAVQALTAAEINQPLGTASTYSGLGVAGWNSAGHTLYTRPTGNGGTLLMATVLNSTPGPVSQLKVSYDLGNDTILAEEISGLRAYYSLSGAAQSWTVIPAFSGDATGNLTATLDLASWASGGLLYIVWADDNGSSMTDGAWIWTNFLAQVPGPLVQITSPANNSSFVLPTNIALAATASGFANTVTNVSFFAGAAKIGSVTASPFNVVWSNPAAGSYAVTAVASDSGGISATSAAVNVTVLSNGPPTVAIAFPSNNAVVIAPASIAIAATATDDFGVSKVEFYEGATKLGQSLVAPYTCAWQPASTGSYQLRAVATDVYGLATTSAVVNVTVAGNVAPVASLTSPANNAVFTSGQNVVLQAAASDADGTVANVEFYASGLLVGSAATSPYGFTWTSPAGGNYALSAVAVDNLGARGTSAPVNVTVTQPGISLGTTWVFDSAPPVTAWSSVSLSGSGGSYTTADALDAAVQTLSAAEINQALETTTTYGTRAIAGWNSANQTVFTRPTVNAATLLMATVINSTPGMVSQVKLTYSLGNDSIVAEEISGPRVYYSLTGAALSWTVIPAFSGDATGTLTATVDLPSWASGSPLYVVWADDNGNGMSDGAWIWTNFLAQIAGPAVQITSPGNNSSVVLPTNITITAATSGFANEVTNVSFYAGAAKLGSVTASPFSLIWSNAVPGSHALTAVASDSGGIIATSAVVSLTVQSNYPPIVAISAPTNSATFTAPVDVGIQATATDDFGIAKVEFYRETTKLGESLVSPYVYAWELAPAGSHQLRAVATDIFGSASTSAVVNITVNPAPPNTVAPTVASVLPAPGATITSLSSVQVLFSEIVTGVDASDLLVNGVPATSVSGGRTSFTFTVTQPAISGPVSITWASTHGIQDVGTPPLAFDQNGTGASWSYTLVEAVPPTISSVTPARGTTLTNLTQVQITFSEPVVGVDANDLLVNGSPSSALSGAGSNYTFYFAQPLPGTVPMSWSATHGITDLSGNAFNASSETWQYTVLVPKVSLVSSNSTWAFMKGTQEASSPMEAWRAVDFDDSSWSNAYAPFFYGDPYSSGYVNYTLLSDMMGSYSSVYLRQKFMVESPDALTNLFLKLQCDDGCIVWINGIEVTRTNMGTAGTTDPGYDGVASANAYEPGNGVLFYGRMLVEPASFLRAGTNVIAIHAFNTSIGSSTDFGIDADLTADLWDPSALPPRVATVSPVAGTVYYLTNITVTFSKQVVGVDASDLLVNGLPASTVSGSSNTYTFAFAQPAYGSVAISWTSTHGITDTRTPALAFDSSGSGSTWQYALVNPNAPVVLAKDPAAGVVSNWLNQIVVTFNKAVTGVDAGDLLVNSVPATNVAGSGAVYTFTFPQPPYGSVAVSWSATHGIKDLSVPANAFSPSQSGNSWSYTFVDRWPPSIYARNPVAGSTVSNLTQTRVVFSEAVTNVDAKDLLINGNPADTVSGSGSNYLFTFAQPNASLVQVSWAVGHGITDRATQPNGFDANQPGATWVYPTFDNVAPTARLDPVPGATIRSLTEISVLFTEPVQGVSAASLLINGQPAVSVNGSGAGPYSFRFAEPPTGTVQVAWSPAQAIRDLASPSNSFAGGSWQYLLDPNAIFEGSVVVNEIMFHAHSDDRLDQWIELYNTTPLTLNLAGWHFSKGVSFVFPAVDLPANSYLVVAADTNRFRAKYPGVANVIGNFGGKLSYIDETIELSDANNNFISRVHYADGGEWARRVSGCSDIRVFELTSSGTTARAVAVGTYAYGDRVVVSGADQSDYNGVFTITGTSGGGGPPCTAFTYTMASAPAVTRATGCIGARALSDQGVVGWGWSNPADGFGRSYELCNPALRVDCAQNWSPSLILEGTPGRVNSVMTNNAAPLVTEVSHSPAVPKPSELVYVTARILDEQTNGIVARVFYRNHTTSTPDAWSSIDMMDDGAHGDGLSGDGIYGAALPAQANGAVVEFYVQAADMDGRARTFPAAALMSDGSLANAANCLYQVDENLAPPSASNAGMPMYRLIFTGSEVGKIGNGGNRNSNAGMNASFIATEAGQTQVRYNTSVRYRGAGTRGRTPTNYRVDIPSDRRWNGNRELNLNSQYIHAQLAGSAVAARAGMPASQLRAIQFRMNGQNLAPAGAPSGGAGFGSYVYQEALNGDWAQRCLPVNAGGNVYRGSKYPWNANLDYLLTGATVATNTGLNFVPYINAGYSKASNHGENDWTDLYRLTWALNRVAAESDYLEAVRTNVNVELFMRYFAVNLALVTRESCIATGVGDDYAMYNGVADPRFTLLPHDLDTVLGEGDTGSSSSQSIWDMVDSPATTDSSQFANFLRRFMRHPEFAPVYFRELKRICDTVLTAQEFNPLMDEILGGWVPSDIVSRMKNYGAARRQSILSQLPMTYALNVPLSTANGYYRSASSSVSLNGQANALETKIILVNGAASAYSVWEGRWTNTVTLQPGLNRVVVQCLATDGSEMDRRAVSIWYESGSETSVAGGSLSGSPSWLAANGPFHIKGSVTVPSGSTLTIQAGTTVYLDSGVGITVANGGCLRAEGTATAPITLSTPPGSNSSWGGITINGGAGSPETWLTYTLIQSNGTTAVHSSGGTLFMDHVTFGTTRYQYLSLDSSSFVVQDCYFPTPTGSFEPAHGSGGIKTGGRGLFLRNYFGAPNGYNDVIDFTGGNRPGQPIVQFINNVFAGASDDVLDLDNTDAWVERNIFLNVHKNGSPDTSSAVSGGSDTGEPSNVTVIGNLFYDCDHAAMAKQGDFFTLINNTIVHQTHVGGQDTEGAVVCLQDNDMSEGAGMYLEGNIIYDVEKLTQNVTSALVTFTNNLLSLPWTGPGGNNSTNPPLLRHVPTVAETTNFTSWAQAQVMWDWLGLQADSPAVGTGPNGADKGGVIPLGVSVSGVPESPTPQTTATLAVGVNRTGNGILTTGWPNGSGFTHYKWRLDSGSWSAETPINTPISLTGLGSGTHYVEVVGKNDADLYQNDSVLGADAVVTVSRSWIVKPDASNLRFSELLAANRGVFVWQGTTPDCIELHNAGDSSLDLYGLSVSDDPQKPDKFIFPYGTTIPARGYLVLFANNPDGTGGLHLGFNLPASGGGVYLFDSMQRGRALLDSLIYGPQAPNLSVGALADSTWGLCQPTLGLANRAANVGDVHALKLNEWLALGQVLVSYDFVEIYNPTALPVALGGLYLTDNVVGWPDQHEIGALSFIPAYGYVAFQADGQPENGPIHLSFKLPAEQGTLGLFDQSLHPIDIIYYTPQAPDVSQGRSPNGGTNLTFFAQPTPGAPNSIILNTNTGVVINEVLANNNHLVETDGSSPDWVELYNLGSTAVDLADFSLSDATTNPRRWVFPAGSTIAGLGYLKVRCDGGAAASTNLGTALNTGFGVKATGGALYLFDKQANGGSLLSAVTYGLQVPDLTVGRVPNGSTNWCLTLPTPLGQNIAATLGSAQSLKINEWFAYPDSGNDWFELYNPGSQPVDLSGLYLSNDLNSPKKHQIPALSYLGAQTNAFQRFWADKNTAAGADHVGFKLSKSGTSIGLASASGVLIDGVQFGPQEQGISEGRLPDGSGTITRFPGTVSPNDSNYKLLADVVISEVLTHAQSPLEQAIELYNRGDVAVDIGGWWLSNAKSMLRKLQIPKGTVLAARDYKVFYQGDFYIADPQNASSLWLDWVGGDQVYLSQDSGGGLTGYRAQVQFDAAELNVSFGRYVTSVGTEDFVPMSAHTFGMDDPGTVEQFRTGAGVANAYPKVGPVVISEIMYHPPDLGTNDNTRDEFIELHNITSAPVPLYDTAYPSNTWHLRNAVDFEFPAGAVLPANGTLVVVSFDPALDPVALEAFRTAYGIGSNVVVFGPYRGKLANDNEAIDLKRPDAPATNDVPYLLVERVKYYDSAPWPLAADGGGLSLQRLSMTGYGNDPTNWFDATPNPGALRNVALDSDADGIPDLWMIQYFGHPTGQLDDLSMASQDADGDGLTNLDEYAAGTNPKDPASLLRLEVTSQSPATVLQFQGEVGKSYTLEYSDALPPSWQTLLSLDPLPASQTMAITNQAPPGVMSRFYRILTPRKP